MFLVYYNYSTHFMFWHGIADVFLFFVFFSLVSSQQFQSFDHINCTNLQKMCYLLLIKVYLGFIGGVRLHKAKDLCLIE